MADEKKSGLIEKIGLFLDKTLTFGGGLKYSQEDINNAVNALDAETNYEIKSWKDIDTQEDFNKFKSILNQMDKQEKPDKGKNGGAVMKMKSGGMATKRNKPASRSNKPRVAGRLASRGYGKAFKGK